MARRRIKTLVDFTVLADDRRLDEALGELRESTSRDIVGLKRSDGDSAWAAGHGGCQPTTCQSGFPTDSRAMNSGKMQKSIVKTSLRMFGPVASPRPRQTQCRICFGVTVKCQVPKITRGLLSRSNDREWAAQPQASPQAPSSAPSMWEDQSSSSLAPGSHPTVEITNDTTRLMVARPGRPVERCNVHYPPRTVHPLPGGACQHGTTPALADWRRTVFPYQDGGGGYWREVIWISYPSRPWIAARRCVCWWWQTADGRWHRAGDYLW